MTEEQFEVLKKRVGSNTLSKRLLRETEHSVLQMTNYGLQLNWESLDFLFSWIESILKFMKLYERGKRNAISYEVTYNKVKFPHLPSSFKGYRILHLSDLHLDGIPDGGNRLIESLKKIEFDMCVLTGDYRFHTTGPLDDVFFRLTKILDYCQCYDGVYAILGNHDFIEMVPGLESLGINVLLNESVRIKRGKDHIFLAGVDDEHFYQAAQFQKIIDSKGDEKFSILLSHAQELIQQAESLGFDLYLCGHTHGGQICLPGGIPLITNTNVGRQFVKGSWAFKGLKGYTTRGVGVSGVPVRYFCPPEIALHILDN